MNAAIAAAPLAREPHASTTRHEELMEEAARGIFNMRRVMRRVLQDARGRSLPPAPAHLGEAQLFVLHVLSEVDQITAGDLAGRCHVADPTMSKTLNHLEMHGLVVRHVDPRNRRTVRVELTPTGRATLAQAGAQWLAHLAELLRPLSSAQLEEVIAAMSHLAGLADPEEAGQPAPVPGVPAQGDPS